MSIYAGQFVPDTATARLFGWSSAHILPRDSNGIPALCIDMSPPNSDPTTRVGLFQCDGTLSSDYKLLGNTLADAVSSTDWQTIFGYSPAAASIGGALNQHFGPRSDPDGNTGVYPLTPIIDRSSWTGAVEVYFAGVQSLRRSFVATGGTLLQQGDRAKLIAMRRAQFRAAFAVNRQQARKMLGAWGRELGLDRPQDLFVPDDLQADAAQPTTDIDEQFAGADSTTWGSNWVANSNYDGATHNLECGKRVSNYSRISPSGGSASPNQYAGSRIWNVAFSSDNWYSQCDIPLFQFDSAGGGGTFVGVDFHHRCDWSGSAITKSYFWRIIGTGNSGGNIKYSLNLWKLVPTASYTQLYDSGELSATNPISSTSTKFDCNGTSLKGYFNASNLITTQTDSGVSGAYYYMYEPFDGGGTTAMRVDNIVADDGLSPVVVSTRRPMSAGGFQTLGVR